MIVARVEAGETIIVTRDGKPIAYLRPAVYPDCGFGVPDDPTSEA
jgi:antitoxin (DNA-binding transcriptional repressor) of toxin-antitoxin stability system